MASTVSLRLRGLPHRPGHDEEHWAVLADGRSVGKITFWHDAAVLVYLEIAEAERRRGYGTAAVRAIFPVLGIARLCGDSTSNARSFWDSLGVRWGQSGPEGLGLNYFELAEGDIPPGA